VVTETPKREAKGPSWTVSACGEGGSRAVQHVSFLEPRIVFLLGSRAREPFLATFLKANSQLPLSSTVKGKAVPLHAVEALGGEEV
jgi:hypothetical protein